MSVPGSSRVPPGSMGMAPGRVHMLGKAEDFPASMRRWGGPPRTVTSVLNPLAGAIDGAAVHVMCSYWRRFKLCIFSCGQVGNGASSSFA